MACMYKDYWQSNKELQFANNQESLIFNPFVWLLTENWSFFHLISENKKIRVAFEIEDRGLILEIASNIGRVFYATIKMHLRTKKVFLKTSFIFFEKFFGTARGMYFLKKKSYLKPFFNLEYNFSDTWTFFISYAVIYIFIGSKNPLRKYFCS